MGHLEDSKIHSDDDDEHRVEQVGEFFKAGFGGGYSKDGFPLLADLLLRLISSSSLLLSAPFNISSMPSRLLRILFNTEANDQRHKLKLAQVSLKKLPLTEKKP